MARTGRDIPKELAEFGQRQFNETGAQSVEVLRVKAATIRKYWAKLGGIAFLVSVVSLDRVRVYFFSSKGVMLVGENIDHELYSKIRSKSKLVRKYEKPTPPTELELRMEATEELRNHLSKSIRRVSRYLGIKEPEFPLTFVTKSELRSIDQSFSMIVEDDGAHIFHEDSVKSQLFEGLSLRSAFLSLLDSPKSQEPISHCIGNSLASLLLKGPQKNEWDKYLREYNKSSGLQDISNHLLKHRETYGSDGFSKILEILRFSPEHTPFSQWFDAISLLHSSHEVSLGTDAWYTIDGFCKSLTKPRKLASRRFMLEKIHLSPRILCNPEPLGISLSAGQHSAKNTADSDWLTVVTRRGKQTQALQVNENLENPIVEIRYKLDLQDVLPKSGGIQSRGRQLIHWVAKTFGVKEEHTGGFEASISFGKKSISESERAVLERLSLGRLDILSNTLIGSPQRIESLVNSGCITLVPNFSHIGIEPTYLLEGDTETITNLCLDYSLESTMLITKSTTFGILASPAIWGKRLLDAIDDSVEINPIIRTSSSRGIIRHELPFSGLEMSAWYN